MQPSNVSPQDRGFVFISYKRENAPQSAMLRKVIEARGFEVWWDLDIQCGQVWNQVLDDAVRDAGCIVVLWSTLALNSPWVTHEASRAMDRGIYAPVRIELCPIDAPYDRIQATDIVDWNGDPNHPGVLRLLRRLDDLLPQPLNAAGRLRRWIRSRLATIASVIFGLLALSILTWQTLAGRRQLSQMASLVEQQKTVAADLKAMRAGQDVFLPRIVTKFSRITASLSVRLPIKHPAVAEYFEKVVQTMTPNWSRSSELWPTRTGPAADIEETMWRFITSRTLPASITIEDASANFLQMEPKQTAPYRSLQSSPHELEVRYSDMQVNFRGALQSLSDIAGARLKVEYSAHETHLSEDAPAEELARVKKIDALFDEIQAGMEISSLELIFDGQAYTFKAFTKQTPSAPGQVAFSMTVPKDLKELQGK